MLGTMGSQSPCALPKAGGAGLVLGGQSLEIGKTGGKVSRQLAFFRRFVDMRRHQVLGLDANLIQQGKAARRGGGQDQIRTAGHGAAYLKR